MITSNVKRLTSISLLFVVFMVIFGAGCRRTPPTVSYEKNDNNPKTAQINPSDNALMDKDELDVSEVGDPSVLAILLLTQNAEVTVSRGAEQTQAINQMELYAGDDVDVTKGEARLLYPNIGISILPEGTRLTIMPGEGAGDEGFSAQILLEAGKIWTRLEQVLGSDESFSVEASNVVATVRGTAFGVSMVDGEIDVTVAGNQVAVSTREAMQNLKETVQNVVMVAAGNSIKVNPSILIPGQNPRAELLKKLRKVTDVEKQDIFYRFASERLDIATLKKPDQTFKWSAPINVGDKLEERLTPAQIERLKAIQLRQIQIRPELLQTEAISRDLIQQSVRFQIPLHEVILLDMQTTDTPTADGPTIK
ncbi:MAG: FecR domain-containing protein [Patescibacteria group bacterium]|nr:FecR domain-containing protein [Patescibacteria group bacterium]